MHAKVVNQKLTPIRAYGDKAMFDDLRSCPKIVYTSVRRPCKEGTVCPQNKYSILQLGWPPEFTKKLGSPCYHGAQFFGADQIDKLDVDFEDNTVSYRLAPGVNEHLCP